jgi:hypothetical protein
MCSTLFNIKADIPLEVIIANHHDERGCLLSEQLALEDIDPQILALGRETQDRALAEQLAREDQSRQEARDRLLAEQLFHTEQIFAPGLHA